MHSKNPFLRVGVTLTLLMIFLSLSIAPVLADTHVEIIAEFDLASGEQPEGIAVDKSGNIYFGFDPLGEIWVISPGGEPELYFAFENPGALGMVVDAPGDLYVTRATFDPASHGVWLIDRDGAAERIPGTEYILFPNSLAFDKVGNLYITDTIYGAVWRVPPGGPAELWIQHELLVGLNLPEIPFPFPLGANGIAYRQGTLYVANTEKALVARIPILVDGNPGEPSIVVEDPALFPVDGISLDVHGNIYALVIAQSTLVSYNPADGSLSTLATAVDGLDFPASLAFGTGNGERQSVFITNYAIGPPGGTGPAILKVDVGEPGLPLP